MTEVFGNVLNQLNYVPLNGFKGARFEVLIIVMMRVHR